MVPEEERDHNIDADLMICTDACCTTGDKNPKVFSIDDFIVMEFDKVIEEYFGLAKCFLKGFIGFIGSSNPCWL